jgi:hypothetical protein
MRHPSTISPAKSSQRKSTPPVSKKFVASSSASKRRPLLPRRPSSQSSTGSEISTSAGSRYLGSQRPVPPITEQTREAGIPRSQDTVTSSGPREGLILSAKAAGKRPAPATSSKRQNLVQGGLPASFSQNRPVVVQAGGSAPQTRSLNEAPGQAPLYEINRTRNEISRSSHPALGTSREGTITSNQPTLDLAPMPMTRSRSNYEQQRPRELSIGRAPPQGLLSGATAGTTNIDAKGTLISATDETIGISVTESTIPGREANRQEVGSMAGSGFLTNTLDSGDLRTRPSSSSLLGDLKEPEATVLPSRPSTSSFRESRFTPTQPSSAPTVPLGRSKSQLTLLLEREKARIGDKPRSKS